ncbi:MAG: preprotein translocase subunit SecE [bacterium]|nr:preprotein translocase subunit SecE [bacterium]
MGRFTLYLKELRREFQRINWPTRGEALKLSLVVIIISLLVAAFLGSLDFVFSTAIQRII